MPPVSRISHEFRHVDANQKGNQLMAGECTTIVWVLTDGSENEEDIVELESDEL
jgi:hypothetical protein